MCRASLMSSVVLFFASSSTLVSSHSIGWCCPQACPAMADFSLSPLLVAALCSFMWVLRALFVSPIYTWPQLQGIWYTTHDFFSSGSWSLTFISCPWRVNADQKTVRMLYLLHTCLTSSLIGLLQREWTPLWASGYPSPSRTPLRWSSSSCMFSPWAIVRARWKRQETMPSFTWRRWWGEKISVCVGGLSVDAYVKGSIVLAVEECVQKR